MIHTFGFTSAVAKLFTTLVNNPSQMSLFPELYEFIPICIPKSISEPDKGFRPLSIEESLAVNLHKMLLPIIRKPNCDKQFGM